MLSLLSVDQGRQVKLFDLEKRENIVKINVKNQKNKRQQIPKIPYKPEVQRGFDFLFLSLNQMFIVFDQSGWTEGLRCLKLFGTPTILACFLYLQIRRLLYGTQIPLR